jgi:excisionase family DNA binding protein
MSQKEILSRATCTVEEAAEVLGIHRDSAYRAAASGELPTLRLGRRLVVPVPRLKRMLGLGDAPPAA